MSTNEYYNGANPDHLDLDSELENLQQDRDRRRAMLDSMVERIKNSVRLTTRALVVKRRARTKTRKLTKKKVSNRRSK